MPRTATQANIIDSRHVYVRLKRPEGYEDVHPELVLEDAKVDPAFEPEVIGPPSAAQVRRWLDALQLAASWMPADHRKSVVEAVMAEQESFVRALEGEQATAGPRT